MCLLTGFRLNPVESGSETYKMHAVKDTYHLVSGLWQLKYSGGEPYEVKASRTVRRAVFTQGGKADPMRGLSS